VLEVLSRRAWLVVTLVKAGRRIYSLCGLSYLCPWQRRVRRWMWRGPQAEWPGPVVFLGAKMECSTIVSLDLRARRSGVRLGDDGPVVEELGGHLVACIGLR
jgi:hypothetical protein